MTRGTDPRERIGCGALGSLVLLLATALLLAACGQQVSPGPVKATGSTLCFVDYQTCVNPIFDAVLQSQSGPVTCSAGGCHSQATGSGGAFKIYPNAQANSPEMTANFFSAKSFANLDNPPNSKLLLKPSATGRSAGVGHAGGNIFPTNADACHVVIQKWISNRVDDMNASVCGTCTAAAIATCGY